jgi:hypothetical protein
MSALVAYGTIISEIVLETLIDVSQEVGSQSVMQAAGYPQTLADICCLICIASSESVVHEAHDGLQVTFK